jgi:hypothetical protein
MIKNETRKKRKRDVIAVTTAAVVVLARGKNVREN